MIEIGENMSADEVERVRDDILHEIFADAYAGMNKFGAHAEQFGEQVQQTVRERGAETRSRENDAATQRKTAPPDGAERYVIETLPNGEKYVKADRQVIFGNDPESWSAQVEDYINGKIRRGEDVRLIAEDGDELVLTATTAGKVVSRYANGKTLDDDYFAIKADAGVHIDELAKVSTRGTKNVDDRGGKHGAFAEDGWNYRTAYFKDFDGKYYRIRISVAIGSDGKVVYNIGDINERNFPKFDGSSVGNDGAHGGEVSSSTTVAHKDDGVNGRFSVDEDSDGRELSKQQAEYFKDSTARDEDGRLLTFYHGTKKGGFTVFRDWAYLTPLKQYAERYTDWETGETMYEVYANITKPFDTRLPECRRIFEEEFYWEYGGT